jgi:predicted RNA-binding protein
MVVIIPIFLDELQIASEIKKIDFTENRRILYNLLKSGLTGEH